MIRTKCADQRCAEVLTFVKRTFEYDLYAKRSGSLAAAMSGVMIGASLAMTVIGQSLAEAQGVLKKKVITLVPSTSEPCLDR